MKSTKLMLAFIAILIVTYLFIAIAIFMLSDMTFKQSASSVLIIVLMVIIGWVPAMVVTVDLDEKL